MVVFTGEVVRGRLYWRGCPWSSLLEGLYVVVFTGGVVCVRLYWKGCPWLSLLEGLSRVPINSEIQSFALNSEFFTKALRMYSKIWSI